MAPPALAVPTTQGSLWMLQELGLALCLPRRVAGDGQQPAGWAQAAARAGDLQPCPSKAEPQLQERAAPQPLTPLQSLPRTQSSSPGCQQLSAAVLTTPAVLPSRAPAVCPDSSCLCTQPAWGAWCCQRSAGSSEQE